MKKIDLSTAKVKNNHISALVLVLLVLAVTAYLATVFVSMWRPDAFYPGTGVTRQTMLSEWYPELADSKGDTAVYILDSGVPGGTMLVLGGTHANEPAGVLAATWLLENAQPTAGKLIVIPQTNISGFTCTDPQEAAPMFYTVSSANGTRTFRYGSRATNPIDQWPDADIYVHASSGQKLSGSETRNLNRTYPGRTDGTFTEKISYAVTTLIKTENVDVTIDLHEASPEYPNINSIVYHENASELSTAAQMYLEWFDGVLINREPSPTNLHGLTHRELGDYTNTLAVLMETSNPAQGRLHGKTSSALVTTGKDSYYVRAAQYGALYVDFTEAGHPISQRVARHLTAVKELAAGYTANTINLGTIPSYEEICANLETDLVNAMVR